MVVKEDFNKEDNSENHWIHAHIVAKQIIDQKCVIAKMIIKTKEILLQFI